MNLPGNWEEIVCSRLNIPGLYPYQIITIKRLLRSLGSLEFEDEDPVENLLCLFPTGMGKTVCFMAPMLLKDSYSIVVYPLNALLADQQRRFRAAGIPCAVIKGNQTRQFREKEFATLKQLGRGAILTNPETLSSPGLGAYLKRFRFKFMVIDEVHLVATWGESFRPAFRELAGIRRRLSIPVLAAFSATLGSGDQDFLREVLFQGSPVYRITAPLDRPNLHFSVLRTLSPYFSTALLFTSLAPIFGIEPLKRPALVFCRTRNQTESCAKYLRAFFSGCEDLSQLLPELRYYHAGLGPELRTRLELEFRASKEAVMACTCAYGTGVDKPDIRSVIHIAAPERPEDYIQESGRSGRDGHPARAILLHSPESNLPAWAEAYIKSCECRRRMLLAYLNEELEGCSGCDSCEKRIIPESIEETLAGWIRKFAGRGWKPQELASILSGRRKAAKLWIGEADRSLFFILSMMVREVPHAKLTSWFRSRTVPGQSIHT